MKVAVVTGLLAKRDVKVYSRHCYVSILLYNLALYEKSLPSCMPQLRLKQR